MADVTYIAIPRGDCRAINVTPTSEGNPIEVGASDYIELTVRALPDPESPVLLYKRSDPGSTIIEVHTQDTLGMEPGRYSADIRYHMGDCVYTIWGVDDSGVHVRNLKNFYILAGVSENAE